MFTRYNTSYVMQVNDGKIKILFLFSAGGSPTKALKELIRVYNKIQKDVDGFMPVSIVQKLGGYLGASEDIKTKITSKDAKSLYNLTFNYPNIVLYLSDRFMELKFNGEIIGTNEAIRELFEFNFISQNDHIGATKPGNVYSIPSQVSGLNVSYNLNVEG